MFKRLRQRFARWFACRECSGEGRVSLGRDIHGEAWMPCSRCKSHRPFNHYRPAEHPAVVSARQRESDRG